MSASHMQDINRVLTLSRLLQDHLLDLFKVPRMQLRVEDGIVGDVKVIVSTERSVRDVQDQKDRETLTRSAGAVQ